MCIIRHMKRLIAIAAILTALMVPSSAMAETVTCRTEQYGGSICGVETSTSTTVEHKYETGLSSRQFYTIIGSLLTSAVVASILYKLTYRNYLLG